MSLPLIPLLQKQLETTLQLLISASPVMTADEIMLVRIRLNEAALATGNLVIDRSDNTTNGNMIYSTHPVVNIGSFLDILDSRRAWPPFGRSRYSDSSKHQYC
jgi:hypothetical protein